jgi:DNA-directed RNA polymerase specialized sigma24 family protein
MGRIFTPGCLLSLLPSHRREPHTQAPRSKRDAQAERFEAFCAQTFPHVDAVYSDAFCLTGSPEDAADLVEAAYVRAFLGYEQFQHRRVPEHLRTRRTRAWLYGNMHAAFCDTVLASCDTVLAHTKQYVTPDGDRP